MKPTYALVQSFMEGLAPVLTENERWGFIDTKGNMVIQPIYEEVGSFSEGLAPVKIQDKWGYIDGKGNTVIKPIYEAANLFTNGIAWVRMNGKDGFIDKKGTEFWRIEREQPNFQSYNLKYFLTKFSIVAVSSIRR